MLTREQKDRLEGLVEIPEVNAVEIQTNKFETTPRNSVSIHLNRNSDLIPLEEAVSRILTTLNVDRRIPFEMDNQEDVLHVTEIRAEECRVSLYARHDKEELA